MCKSETIFALLLCHVQWIDYGCVNYTKVLFFALMQLLGVYVDDDKGKD